MVVLDFHLRITSLGIWGSLFGTLIDSMILSLSVGYSQEGELKSLGDTFPLKDLSPSSSLLVKSLIGF